MLELYFFRDVSNYEELKRKHTMRIESNLKLRER